MTSTLSSGPAGPVVQRLLSEVIVLGRRHLRVRRAAADRGEVVAPGLVNRDVDAPCLPRLAFAERCLAVQRLLSFGCRDGCEVLAAASYGRAPGDYRAAMSPAGRHLDDGSVQGRRRGADRPVGGGRKPETALGRGIT